MGWEKRGDGLYYYRKKRVGDRVLSEYVGTGLLAEAIADLDARARLRRELDRQVRRERREDILDIARAGDDAQAVILTLTRAWLLAQGYHTHKREWRLRREQYD